MACLVRPAGANCYDMISAKLSWKLFQHKRDPNLSNNLILSVAITLFSSLKDVSYYYPHS